MLKHMVNFLKVGCGLRVSKWDQPAAPKRYGPPVPRPRPLAWGVWDLPAAPRHYGPPRVGSCRCAVWRWMWVGAALAPQVIAGPPCLPDGVKPLKVTGPPGGSGTALRALVLFELWSPDTKKSRVILSPHLPAPCTLAQAIGSSHLAATP